MNTVNRINNTMRNFRYILESGSRKDICPNCLKKRFVRYVDTVTGEYLPERFGRCDRESNCGYICNPYKDESITLEKCATAHKKPKPLVFIPIEILERTLSEDRYKNNTFVQNLINNIPYPFSQSDVMKVVNMYRLGTIATGYREGAVTFPFIDKNGQIRAIQAKQFDKENHTTSTDFIHSIVERFHIARNEQFPEWLVRYKENEKKVSCLFGEHLLNRYKSNPVALVEEPKTAVISTLYFGQPLKKDSLLWLAVYNLSSINFDRCKVLKGRDVFLFPDLSKYGYAYNLWKQRAEQIQSKLPNTRFMVSDYLEKRATDQEREKGHDLADYLIQKDWYQFR